MAGEMTQLLTIKAAAKYLGISDDTLREYERRGLIDCVRFPSLVKDGPRRVRQFTQASLDAFIAVHTVGHKTEIEEQAVPENRALQKQGQNGQKGGNVHWMESRAAK